MRSVPNEWGQVNNIYKNRMWVNVHYTCDTFFACLPQVTQTLRNYVKVARTHGNFVTVSQTLKNWSH